LTPHGFPDEHRLPQALFPASITGLAPITGGGATAGSLRIYNTTSADTVGIYSRVTSNVIHQMTLIAGSTSATGNPAPGVGLNDTHVLANTLAAGTPTPSAGTLEFCTNVKYLALSGTNGGNVAMNSGAGNWNGWTLSTVSNKGQAVNNGPITFPTFNGSTAIHIWGWCVTANAASAGNPSVPTSATQMVTGSPGIPTILAYGDLSFARTVSQGDTPSFTSQAVVITLD